MPIKYKVDILAALKAAGFSSYRIRQEALINQTALSRIRAGKLISWEQLAAVCALLKCQPGDLVEYVEDEKSTSHADIIPANSAYAAVLREDAEKGNIHIKPLTQEQIKLIAKETKEREKR